MITTGFTFDLKDLRGTEGFPEAAKKMVESQGGRLDRMTAQQRAEMTKLRGWTTQAYGMFAEYEVTKMLERVFSSEPCCLINSFTENQLVTVAKEALDPGNTEGPLSPDVRNHILGTLSIPARPGDSFVFEAVKIYARNLFYA